MNRFGSTNIALRRLILHSAPSSSVIGRDATATRARTGAGTRARSLDRRRQRLSRAGFFVETDAPVKATRCREIGLALRRRAPRARRCRSPPRTPGRPTSGSSARSLAHRPPRARPGPRPASTFPSSTAEAPSSSTIPPAAPPAASTPVRWTSPADAWTAAPPQWRRVLAESVSEPRRTCTHVPGIPSSALAPTTTTAVPSSRPPVATAIPAGPGERMTTPSRKAAPPATESPASREGPVIARCRSVAVPPRIVAPATAPRRRPRSIVAAPPSTRRPTAPSSTVSAASSVPPETRAPHAPPVARTPLARSVPAVTQSAQRGAPASIATAATCASCSATTASAPSGATIRVRSAPAPSTRTPAGTTIPPR